MARWSRGWGRGGRRAELIVEQASGECPQLNFDAPKVGVNSCRFWPKAAKLATGHTAQASEAPGGPPQATKMSLLLLGGLLPGRVASQVRGRTGEVV